MENAMSDILTGSCLCGGVKYLVSSHIEYVSHCHCSMCRKAHGAAFATYGSVRRPAHRFSDGVPLLRQYKSSPIVTRSFCSACGSPMLWESEGEFADFISFPLGGLDTEFIAPKHRHIYVGSKAPWYDIEDDWPQAAER
jgi:hypothetical protein